MWGYESVLCSSVQSLRCYRNVYSLLLFSNMKCFHFGHFFWLLFFFKDPYRDHGPGKYHMNASESTGTEPGCGETCPFPFPSFLGRLQSHLRMLSSKMLFKGKLHLLDWNHPCEIDTCIVFGFNKTKINTNYIHLTFILNHLLRF